MSRRTHDGFLDTFPADYRAVTGHDLPPRSDPEPQERRRRYVPMPEDFDRMTPEDFDGYIERTGNFEPRCSCEWLTGEVASHPRSTFHDEAQ